MNTEPAAPPRHTTGNLAPWLEIRELRGKGLAIDLLAIRPGEIWCLWGENRSGLDPLLRYLSGDRDAFTCTALTIPADLAVVSFSSQQRLFEEEVRKDDTDYLDKIDPGTPAGDFLGTEGNREELIRLFRLGHVLDVGYRQLSSGESRKLLLLRAITRGVHHLLVQNPYDGLDVESCTEFDRIAAGLPEHGIEIIITQTSRRDIPPWCTHLAAMQEGKLVRQGVRSRVLGEMPVDDPGSQWFDGTAALSTEKRGARTGRIIVSLKNGRARYGDKVIFSGLDLQVAEGEHTLITGPNGAGKSTLLAIISGDHPDCYGNDLHLFGIRRGSGESIWDLKRQMGIVSPELHRSHYVSGSTLQIVISGFFDSIGLYRKYTPAHERQALAWLRRLGLEDRAEMPFRQLSFGEQRLALIARALIKMPKLLLLDEPTQGLDDSHRESLLQFLAQVASAGLSTIFYVSHRQDEYRDFFKQHLAMEKYNKP
jgi:molybdate transport system ATP-binding protein